MIHPVNLLLILLITDTGITLDPGIILRLSKDGIFQLAQNVMRIESEKLIETKFPEISGSTDAAGGTVDYVLSDIRIRNKIHPIFHIDMLPEKGINVHFTDLTVLLDGNWHYDYEGIIDFSSSGSFELELSGLKMSVILSFLATTEGKPLINEYNCNGWFDYVDIEIYNMFSWLYDLIKGKIEDTVNQPCSIIKQIVSTVINPYLSQLPMQLIVKDDLVFDYRLLNSPSFSEDNVIINLIGEFYASQKLSVQPFQQLKSTMKDFPSDRMIRIWTSESVIRSLVYSLKQHYFLSRTLTKTDLPKSAEGLFNTTCQSIKCLCYFVPQMGKLYPNSFLEITLNAENVPEGKILNKRLFISVSNLTINFQARLPNNSSADLFIFAVNTSLDINITASNDFSSVFWHFSDFTFNSKLINSKIGWIPSYMITKITEAVLRFVVITEINVYGRAGRRLELISKVKLNNSQIIFEDGYASVESDFQIQSEKRRKPYKFKLPFKLPYSGNKLTKL